MSNPWFRMYSEFATDPKVQMLSEKDQRRYIMLLCLRCSNADVTLHETEIAFQLRITDEELAATKQVLLTKGLINDDFTPTAWDKRQYVSDSSAKRVAAHRARKKATAKRACNVTVTPPDTDTDTDIKPTHTPGGPASADPEPGATSPTGLETLGLEWQPDNAMLTAYAYRAGIPPGKFTPEAVGPFVVHHNAKGTLKTHAEHVAALVGWVKRDLVRDNRVVPLASRRTAASDFDDNATGWLGE